MEPRGLHGGHRPAEKEVDGAEPGFEVAIPPTLGSELRVHFFLAPLDFGGEALVTHLFSPLRRAR